MAIGATINSIKTSRETIETLESQIRSARESQNAEQETLRTLNEQLELDIRDANTNGAGNVAAGFLDGLPAGTTQTFRFSNNAKTIHISFQYDVDADNLFGINLTFTDAGENNAEL